MSSPAIQGFITKKEVEERYGRSHRSLTRDISSAVRTGDKQILQHLKIRTEDKTVHDGDDVTMESIQDWSNNGLSPTWYIEDAWAAEQYSKKENTSKETTGNERQPPTENGDFISRDDSELVRHLEEVVRDLKSDKDELRNELKIKNQQIEKQNDLTEQLQKMLGDWQKRAFDSLPSPTVTPEPKTKGADTIDAIEVEEDVPNRATSTAGNERRKTVRQMKRSTPKHPKAPSRTKKKTSPDKRKQTSASKQKASAKKQQTKKVTPKKKPAPTKPKGIFSGWFS